MSFSTDISVYIYCWHTCMEYLAETGDAINWANNTSVKRIGIPDELSDGVSSEPSE
jgi:hypothetical protein